ncbi:Hypothetical protein ORPV_153, partial [Orpheovirus IHUMI-LCC2]
VLDKLDIGDACILDCADNGIDTRPDTGDDCILEDTLDVDGEENMDEGEANGDRELEVSLIVCKLDREERGDCGGDDLVMELDRQIFMELF